MRAIGGLSLVVMLVACEPIPKPPPPFEPPTEPPSDAELIAARPYQLRVPDSYDGGTALPLLVALHGYGGTSKELVDYYDLERFADSRDFFLFAPQGLKDSRGISGWIVGHTRWPNWDVSYISAVIKDARAKYAIDASRVIVFGASQGGHMAYRMACDDADEVTVAMVVAGQAPIDGSCSPSKPVSVLHMHGTADEAIGYEGDIQNFPPDPRIPSAHDTVAEWAANDGCSGGLVEDPNGLIDVSLDVPGAETKVESYAGCPAGIDVTFWTMTDVVHRPNPNASFTSRMFTFASDHPRP